MAPQTLVDGPAVRLLRLGMCAENDRTLQRSRSSGRGGRKE
jgi:hypothetical protein